MGPSGRTPVALLILSIAALLSSWNPVSAPLGLAVAVLTAALCLRERRRDARFTLGLRAALALSLVAAAVSAGVTARLAGVWSPPEGKPLVEEPRGRDREGALEAAERRTREAREAARKELEQLGPGR